MGMSICSRDQKDLVSYSIWSWYPILDACIMANEMYLDNRLDLSGMGYNDGNGLKTAKESQELAGALEALLSGVTTLSTSKRHAGHEFMEALSGIKVMDITVTIDKERVVRFINFLKKCDGFEVW